MRKHVVFFFTGTGNSLKVSKDIASALGDCELVPMGACTQYDLTARYETIGFVFPTYYRGIPRKVREFVERLNLLRDDHAYYYAVTTMGKHDGNALHQIMTLLGRKGIALNYAQALDMYSNYVISYDMRDTVVEEAEQSEVCFQPILRAILDRKTNHVPRARLLDELAYRIWARRAPRMDRFYSVSDNCSHCGVCEGVCPVGNIILDGQGRPHFQHHCEQCVACIQFCPPRAINYRDKTQNRGRYRNPEVSAARLSELYRRARTGPRP
ncbi:MAG TPA: EFR1 family ferrodoxin [Spirochaetia bacterium]|nr:EFR1 family ferrodoxin [Spirochaetia bacterium]